MSVSRRWHAEQFPPNELVPITVIRHAEEIVRGEELRGDGHAC
jgi:hypothetical protein